MNYLTSEFIKKYWLFKKAIDLELLIEANLFKRLFLEVQLIKGD